MNNKAVTISLAIVVGILIASLLFQTAYAGPIIVGQGAGESEYSILFARSHLDDLLSTCAGDKCHFSSIEKEWLKTTRTLAQNPPRAIFKNKATLGNLIYFKHSVENEVWLNQDLLWLDAAGSIPYKVSDGVTLWMEILLKGLDIPDSVLANLQIGLRTSLNERIQAIFSSGENTEGFTAILWTHKDANDDLYFRDQTFQTFSGIDSIRKAALCEKLELRQIKFHSARWNASWTVANSTPRLLLRLEVAATWNCGTQAKRGRLQIVMMAAHKDVYEIDPESIRAFAERD